METKKGVQIDDFYFYEVSKNLKNCIFYLKGDDKATVKFTGEIKTLIDNFLLEKLSKVAYFNRVKAAEAQDLPESSVNPIIKHSNSQINGEIVINKFPNSDGKEIPEFEVLFRFPEYKLDSDSCKIARDDVQNDLVKILKDAHLSKVSN